MREKIGVWGHKLRYLGSSRRQASNSRLGGLRAGMEKRKNVGRRGPRRIGRLELSSHPHPLLAAHSPFLSFFESPSPSSIPYPFPSSLSPSASASFPPFHLRFARKINFIATKRSANWHRVSDERTPCVYGVSSPRERGVDVVRAGRKKGAEEERGGIFLFAIRTAARGSSIFPSFQMTYSP